jgi:hypothetical protein
MLRELMRRMRIARRLADLCAWCLILAAGIFVVAWWAEHGPAVIGRIAAWSSAPDVSRPPQPAKLGARKRAYFERLEIDRLEKAVKAESSTSAAASP